MERNCINFVDTHASTTVDYCLNAALVGTEYNKYLYELNSSGLFTLNHLPSLHSSDLTLSQFCDRYLVRKTFGVDLLKDILRCAHVNKLNKVVPAHVHATETPSTLVPVHWDNVTIYTDGGYNKNSDVAAFGVTIENPHYNDERKYSSLTECSRIPGKQDNYRAELYAILRALKQCHSHQSVVIKSDSKSGIDAIKAYLKGSLETKLKYGNRGLLDCICKEYKRIYHVDMIHVYFAGCCRTGELLVRLSELFAIFDEVQSYI